jgi:hypothetical protein
MDSTSKKRRQEDDDDESQPRKRPREEQVHSSKSNRDNGNYGNNSNGNDGLHQSIIMPDGSLGVSESPTPPPDTDEDRLHTPLLGQSRRLLFFVFYITYFVFISGITVRRERWR